MNFAQLGQLLNLIENYDRFYGVSSIRIGSMKRTKDTGELEAQINLTLVSFWYSGSTPLDTEVDKFLNNFAPSPQLLEELHALKEKDWTPKKSFLWKKPPRDPFDQEQVLIRVAEQTDKTAKKEKLGPPPEQAQLKVALEDLQEIRNFLHMLVIAESWAELQVALKEKNYEKKLTGLQITRKNDPNSQISKKVLGMRKELKNWKISIRDADRKQKARQLTIFGKKRIEEMRKLYTEGKLKGSQSILQKVRNIHNEIMPQFKQFADLEFKIPELKTLRKQTEELYNKAETQIKIIQLAAKLNLRGVIYMAKNDNLSVAFINEKVVHKNDVLMMGFVVDQIQAEGVILRYKEETVPIRLKRLSKDIGDRQQVQKGSIERQKVRRPARKRRTS